MANVTDRMAMNDRGGSQWIWLSLSVLVIAVMLLQLSDIGWRSAALHGIGVAMGITLYHASFGFTGAYRRAIETRDLSGIAAQIVMLVAAMVLFAPVLAMGEVWGRPLGGAVAPVSVSMAFGAFLFGIGMQFGSGCASGTLFSAGGGRSNAIVVLLFFCLGGFWGSLDLHWWADLPGIGAVSLAERLGYPAAVGLQVLLLATIWLILKQLGFTARTNIWRPGVFAWPNLMRGPWPLAWAALLLAILNWLSLLVAGHPWSITWAFALWVAKFGAVLGWDPATSAFWSGDFQQGALGRSVLHDTTSIMNIGIIAGATLAASLAGRIKLRPLPGGRQLLLAVGGGLAMGYGARLSYGCNIGAFFSGVASTSLHGWIWILCAIPGNIVGLRLRHAWVGRRS